MLIFVLASRVHNPPAESVRGDAAPLSLMRQWPKGYNVSPAAGDSVANGVVKSTSWISLCSLTGIGKGRTKRAGPKTISAMRKSSECALCFGTGAHIRPEGVVLRRRRPRGQPEGATILVVKKATRKGSPYIMESLILAQNERWRRVLRMQVERHTL